MVNFSAYVQISIRHLAKSSPLNPLSHHLRDGACATALALECSVTQMHQYSYFKVYNQPRQPANQELRDRHHKKSIKTHQERTNIAIFPPPLSYSKSSVILRFFHFFSFDFFYPQFFLTIVGISKSSVLFFFENFNFSVTDLGVRDTFKIFRT